MKQLTGKDIIIFDRKYFGYLFLYKLSKQRLYGVFRLQEGGANNKTLDFWKSNQDDAIIAYNPSVTAIHDLKKKGINLDVKPLNLYLIKHRIGDEA